MVADSDGGPRPERHHEAAARGRGDPRGHAWALCTMITIMRSQCKVDGCDRFMQAKGLCPMHYMRARQGKPMTDPPLGRHGRISSGPITYSTAHSRVLRLRGPASGHTCSCGTVANEWAYIGGDPNECRGQNGRGTSCDWSGDPSFYEAMCWPCHRAFDSARKKAL